MKKPHKIIICQNVGYTGGHQRWSQRTNVDGQRYWHVTEQIGSLGGHEVDGELTAFGRTKKEATLRLQAERNKLLDCFFGCRSK